MARAEALSEQERAEALARRVASGGLVATPALRAARRELQQARATLSDQHPRVRALEARVRDLESGSGGRSRPGSGLARRARRASSQAEERQDTYQSLVEQARERLNELSEVEGEASRLLSAVHVKEAALAELEGDLARAQAEATTARSGFRLLAPALPPEEPSSSNRRAMAVFILLGIVALTILALLGWELRGLRAHTANEVAFWGRGPVLGATSWPREKRPLSPLIEELGDYALESGGTTLVVAASDRDQAIAAQVAELLHLDTDLEHGAGEEDVYFDPEEELAVDVRRGVHVTPPPPHGARAPADDGEDVVPVSGGPVDRPDGSGNGHGASRAIVPVGRARAFPLARRQGAFVPPRIATWRGEGGPPARRAARVADRVIVVVPSGGMSFGELERLRQTLGRENDDGVGYLVFGVRPELATLPDRAGPVEDFWRTRRL